MPDVHYVYSLDFMCARRTMTSCGKVAYRCKQVTTIKKWVTCKECKGAANV